MGRILGAAAALIALLVFVYVIATQSTRSVNAAELYAQWFEPHELTYGLVAAEGAVLPRGDVTLRFETVPRVDEAPRIEPAKSLDATKPAPAPEWAKLAIGAANTPPRDVLIARLPLALAAKELDALFKGGMELAGDYSKLGAEGGKRTIDRGHLPWGTFDAAYVIEREFEAGGTFRDFLRVNLSREQTPCVLLAVWNRGFPASKARIGELLAVLRAR